MPVSPLSLTPPSTMPSPQSSTSLIRSADTCADGSIMNIMTIIMKDMTT